ncbi:MAG: helix-turn-helix transcriptional regulator [Clostridiales bacterium]|nr:helix-turn-helix transcriptional regulator [Clostridiales bacterium]
METSLGKRIAALRRQMGMTQDELAEKLGVSAQAVSKWENDLSCPDIMLLPRLAQYLNTSVDVLLSGEPEPETQLLLEKERKPIEQMLLKIVVNSADGDKVRVNLPLALIQAGLEMGVSSNIMQLSGSTAIQHIDFEQIMKLIESGVNGKLVEVETKDGDYVEIWVE